MTCAEPRFAVQVTECRFRRTHRIFRLIDFPHFEVYVPESSFAHSHRENSGQKGPKQRKAQCSAGWGVTLHRVSPPVHTITHMFSNFNNVDRRQTASDPGKHQKPTKFLQKHAGKGAKDGSCKSGKQACLGHLAMLKTTYGCAWAGRFQLVHAPRFRGSECQIVNCVSLNIVVFCVCVCVCLRKFVFDWKQC